MSKIKIYIIASVSSLFIGVSVGLMVSEQATIANWAIVMGLFAAAGGMAIELTVPETLITVWSRSGPVYKTLAVIATVASPSLLIWSLPAHGIARFSIAFIVASLITYISFYAMERIKADESDARIEQAKLRDAELKAKLEEDRLRLKAELKIDAEKLRLQEERKTQKALAKLHQTDTLPLTTENVVDTIKTEQGISQRELGRRFGKSPQTVLARVGDLMEAGIITANGDGVHWRE